MIRITDLSHNLGTSRVLHGIDLTIPKGQITALIGPNGAGKSTLLSLIARLDTPLSGRIDVDELQVGACPTDVLARRLAILPQTPEIAPRLSVAELVGFGRYPHHKGRPTPEDRARVSDAIALLSLDGLAHRSLDTLSGGQRQRALLAMTVAQDTDYLLLDEPLNNLDIAASRSLMTLLRRLCEDFGRTVVVVLHDINYASRYADWKILSTPSCPLGSRAGAMQLVWR
ncbi:ATP-binding cassette domain-containing protein [Paracoccus albicereus]|uniref:ATP-binding cassette domain-containing protein n=1 Tax=Paracoccus albicereus TaxID=2922394 RepID=UPI003F76A602